MQIMYISLEKQEYVYCKVTIKTHQHIFKLPWLNKSCFARVSFHLGNLSNDILHWIFYNIMQLTTPTINLSTKRWRLMLQQMRESIVHQTLLVQEAYETKKIKSSDWPKWHCVSWRYIISCLFSDQTSFQMVQQTGCRYGNYNNNRHSQSRSSPPESSLRPFSNSRALVHRPVSFSCSSPCVFFRAEVEAVPDVCRNIDLATSWYCLVNGLKSTTCNTYRWGHLSFIFKWQ